MTIGELRKKIQRKLERKAKKVINDIIEVNILLLTNRDSDNVGDQIIEACDIKLISTIMENLGYRKTQYKIASRAAGIITKKYLKTMDDELLKSAEESISAADILIFGGAPIFNYAYQIFYKRTIITLELAEKHNIPVIFSSIGVEEYDDDNKKCQQLKQALNLPCVKQITTRDDLASLEKFITKDDILVRRVSDPAVFADKVFEKYKKLKTPMTKKTIGLAVVRSAIFKDNKIDFSEQEQLEFWDGVRTGIVEKGYDYQFFTTGHFSDEVFLDVLMRKLNIPMSKCVFNMNTPERLIEKISAYSGVVAYRLHANITSYSLGIPSIGLIWNQKIPMFYEAIDYPGRAIGSKDWNPETVVTALDGAMAEGVKKNEGYIASVYDTMFESMRSILKPAQEIKKYSPAEIRQNMPVYTGTSSKEYELKLSRKFRRTYDNYHQLQIKLMERNAK